MDLSNILFQTFIMVLVTSLSGSLIVKIWLAYALRLESAGCWHLFNYGIRGAILFWGLPLVYMILMLAGKSFSFLGRRTVSADAGDLLLRYGNWNHMAVRSNDFSRKIHIGRHRRI